MDIFQIFQRLQLVQITADFIDNSSDEKRLRWEKADLQPRKVPNLNRDHRLLRDILYRQFFDANPGWDHSIIRRFFRVTCNTFRLLLIASKSANNWYVLKRDWTGLFSIFPFQMLTTVMRMMTYDIDDETVDKKNDTLETCAIEMAQFLDVVIAMFETEYRRITTMKTVRCIFMSFAKCSFPGTFVKENPGEAPWKRYLSYRSGYDTQFLWSLDSPTIKISLRYRSFWRLLRRCHTRCPQSSRSTADYALSHSYLATQPAFVCLYLSRW